MSFLHCACTRAHVEDSPKSATPYPRDIPYPPLVTKRVDERYMPAEMTGAGTCEGMINFETDPTYYELYTVIGKACGEASTITLGRHIPSGTHVAIRRTDLEKCPIDFNTLQSEAVLSHQLQHEKVLPLLCSFVFNHEMWSVTPMMAFGSCFDLLHAHFCGGLPEQAIAYVIRDILQALEYLHSRAIIHRSVRASHVLISANGRVCLGGLRTAYCMIREGQRFRCAYDYPSNCTRSLQWFAPEILEQNLSGYDTKSDIYSIGILSCELANGCAPYSDMTATQMLLEKVKGIKPVLCDSSTLPADLLSEVTQPAGEQRVQSEEGEKRHSAAKYASQRTFSRHFHNFVDICLEKDPRRRPSATILLGHPFLKSLKKKTSEVLPELLYPVSPLTNLGDLPKCDVTLEATTSQLENISIAEPWIF
ncbi:STE20-related kinase adapter protein alpha-like [Liolophura sinensis]|uniref:STE20-related kinase adapter protein alpha-like n=1 Tax=Liolophura sinensis TaxID=3198878 RepID=UPI003157F238